MIPSELPGIGVEIDCEYLGLLALRSRKFDISDVLSDDINRPPKKFKSDGCSCWPDKWFNGKENVSIYEACFWHDVRYWMGRKGDYFGRLKADIKLMVDVARLHSVTLGIIMFLGVRVGGGEFGFSFSWGFGWDD